jgi:hypothetical protein
MVPCSWCALLAPTLTPVRVRHMRSGERDAFALCERCRGEHATWRIVWVEVGRGPDDDLLQDADPDEVLARLREESDEVAGAQWRRS